MAGPMMDVDKLRDALEAPRMSIGGTEYEGRYPSFKERMRIEALMQDWPTDVADEEKAFREIAGYLDLPADPLLELPEALLGEVLLYFLAISRGALTQTTMTVSPTSSESDIGSASSDSAATSPQVQ